MKVKIRGEVAESFSSDIESDHEEKAEHKMRFSKGKFLQMTESFEGMDIAEFEDEKEETVNLEECKSQAGFDSVGLGDQQEPSIIFFRDDCSEVNKTSHDMEDEVDGETDFMRK